MDMLLTPLLEAANSGKIQKTGPIYMVYTDMSDDMSRPFKLQVGAPVRPGTEGWDNYKIRTLQPLRAATVMYSGSLANIGQAYQQIFTDLFAAGLTPSGQNREIYLYWEGTQSSNNVVLIQIGIR